MKKGRKNQSHAVFNEEPLHFRLCHGCWHLNESGSEVTSCERCHRAFPSQFAQEMFGDRPFGAGLMPREVWDEEESEEADEEDAGEDDDSGEYRRAPFGLTGLSVRW